MKINARYYPAIILTAFVLFMLIGVLLGFSPREGRGRQQHGAWTPVHAYILLAADAPA